MPAKSDAAPETGAAATDSGPNQKTEEEKNGDKGEEEASKAMETGEEEESPEEVEFKPMTADEVAKRFSLEGTAEERAALASQALIDVCLENDKSKMELEYLRDRCAKSEYKSTTFAKLTEALRAQVDLVRTEGELRLKEETQKRIDTSKAFQDTVGELSTLMQGSSGCNTKLREENMEMAKKLGTLLKQMEEKEKRMQGHMTEHQLQMQLYEAQLAKAKIQRAEASAEFTRERVEMHKRLLESRQENEELLQQTTDFKTQLDVYQKQCAEFESGLGASSDTFGQFRTEMDRLGRKLREVEADTAEWRRKFESSSEQVRRMNAAAADREKELEAAKKRASAMEKLNRALQAERTDLINKMKNGAKGGEGEENVAAAN